ncbi:UPF0146 family protein [Halorubrum sp. DTA46]|uniref:UPF0146 family protein n=1 Tax=Halorubrum sp. DTA46 TaxID=3402162 RepID=UPI003AAA7185
MVSSVRRVLVPELARYDRLLEVGVGDRPGVASALAARGCDATAIDVDVGERTREAADETVACETAEYEPATASEAGVGSLRAIEGDVFDTDLVERFEDRFDAVYGLNLPAELQRPTVELAARLDAACLFTTLGFEEPIVAVERRFLDGTTLYVARTRGERGGGGHR